MHFDYTLTMLENLLCTESYLSLIFRRILKDGLIYTLNNTVRPLLYGTCVKLILSSLLGIMLNNLEVVPAKYYLVAYSPMAFFIIL